MTGRPETQPWDIPSAEEEVIEDGVEENVGRLADYLADGAPDSIEIGCVFPLAKIGIMYTLLLGRDKEINEEIVSETYRVDGNIFETLHSSVSQWTREQIKDNEEFFVTVMEIKEYVRNPFNWPPPAYNPRPN